MKEGHSRSQEESQTNNDLTTLQHIHDVFQLLNSAESNDIDLQLMNLNNYFLSFSKILTLKKNFNKSRFYVQKIPKKKPNIIENIQDQNQRELQLHRRSIENFKRNNTFLSFEEMLDNDNTNSICKSGKWNVSITSDESEFEKKLQEQQQ